MNGFHFINNETIMTVYYFGMAENFLFTSYKISVVVYYSKEIRQCMEIMTFDFLSYKGYSKRVFEAGRIRSVKITYFITIMIYLVYLFYLLCPLFSNLTITLKKPDGSFSSYKSGAINMYTLILEETYSKHFVMFYIF